MQQAKGVAHLVCYSLGIASRMTRMQPRDTIELRLSILRQPLTATPGRAISITLLIKDQVDAIKIRKEHIRIGDGSAIFCCSVELKVFLSVPVLVIHIIRAGPGQVVPAHHHTASQIRDVPVRHLSPVVSQTGI